MNTRIEAFNSRLRQECAERMSPPQSAIDAAIECILANAEFISTARSLRRQMCRILLPRGGQRKPWMEEAWRIAITNFPVFESAKLVYDRVYVDGDRTSTFVGIDDDPLAVVGILLEFKSDQDLMAADEMPSTTGTHINDRVE